MTVEHTNNPGCGRKMAALRHLILRKLRRNSTSLWEFRVRAYRLQDAARQPGVPLVSFDTDGNIHSPNDPGYDPNSIHNPFEVANETEED